MFPLTLKLVSVVRIKTIMAQVLTQKEHQKERKIHVFVLLSADPALTLSMMLRILV